MKKKKGPLGAWVSALFGGRKKHILDGPGMINDQPWNGFTLSDADFRFSVRQSDFTFLLTGQCRGAAGEALELTEGAELSAEDLQFLRELALGELPDAAETVLSLTFPDGKERKKALPGDLSMQIYQRFLPYFQKAN